VKKISVELKTHTGLNSILPTLPAQCGGGLTRRDGANFERNAQTPVTHDASRVRWPARVALCVSLTAL